MIEIENAFVHMAQKWRATMVEMMQQQITGQPIAESTSTAVTTMYHRHIQTNKQIQNKEKTIV